MAAPMIAAATLGFLGSKATSFVLAPAGQTSTTAIGAVATTGYQPAAQPAAGVSTGALAAGLSLGFAGAAASVKPRARAARQAGFDPTSSIGVCQPMGFWDPCGLMKERVGKDGWEWKDQKTFDKYRVAELKHGRVAMLAMVGMLTTTCWKFPGVFQEIPDGMKALETSVGGSGFGILFILAAWFEITYPTGDFDVPGPWGATEEMKGKEIANGRLAMAAVMTLLITEYGTGLTPAGQFAETLGNLSGSGGFYAAWALFFVAFAWTQPQGAAEVAWSSKNFLYSKGLGPQPEALKPVAVNISAKLPEAEEKKVEEKKVEEKAVAAVEA